ncbi:MAG: hypothetical protein ACO398_03970 [Kiritimatiellia bacterium]|jgi:hypothetical protein
MMFYNQDDEEEGYGGDEMYQECEVCHQEYRGFCPINSADCPYDEDEDDDFGFDDDDEEIEGLLGDDEEIEKIIDSDDEIPVEDLMDGAEPSGEEEEEEGPSKTIEEIEAEEAEAAAAARKKKKSAGKKDDTSGKASKQPAKSKSTAKTKK